MPYEVIVSVFDDGTLAASGKSTDEGDHSGWYKFRTELQMPVELGDYVILSVAGNEVPFDFDEHANWGWNNVKKVYELRLTISKHYKRIVAREDFDSDHNWKRVK